jgi:hypothetical protein
LMGAGHIVVVDIGLQHPSQMSLVQNQEMIQAFFSGWKIRMISRS